MYSIGIGVTTRNRPNLIKEFVDNLKKFSVPHYLVIIDDASEINVRSILGYVPNTRVFRFEEPIGIAAGKNKCLEELKLFDYIFLFDDDCWPSRKGWEKLYIDTSKKTGCHHFCFIWDDCDDGSKTSCEKIEIHKDIDVVVKTDGYPDLISKSENLAHINHLKRKNGVNCSTPSDLEIVVNYQVNQYSHACGVMMFYTRESIDAVGGFNRKYGIYGNEHIALTNRIYNKGLNPFGVYLDVENSKNYLFAHDKAKNNHTSVLSNKFRNDCLNLSQSVLDEEIASDHYYCYCSFSCKCNSTLS